MEFQEFPKIARLSRECVITEKIDGTNASIVITPKMYVDPFGVVQSHMSRPGLAPLTIAETADHVMLAGSRTRYITPENDNHGFARWVKQNADALWSLGEGTHFGEWWGSGIQSGYGLTKGEKRFSLFNVARWGDPHVRDMFKYPNPRPECCHVVPLLARGIFTTELVEGTLEQLRTRGSFAAPGFMKPEGVIVFHTANGTLFKKTLHKDEEPKGKGKQ